MSSEFSGDRIKSFVERVERLTSQKEDIAEDIKEVYAEVKASGLEAKIIRKLVSIRKQDSNKRREEEELLDLYMCAAGIE